MLEELKKQKLEKDIEEAVDTTTLVRKFMSFITTKCNTSEIKDALAVLKDELSSMSYYDDVKQEIYHEMETIGLTHDNALELQ